MMWGRGARVFACMGLLQSGTFFFFNIWGICFSVIPTCLLSIPVEWRLIFGKYACGCKCQNVGKLGHSESRHYLVSRNKIPIYLVRFNKIHHLSSLLPDFRSFRTYIFGVLRWFVWAFIPWSLSPRKSLSHLWKNKKKNETKDGRSRKLIRRFLNPKIDFHQNIFDSDRTLFCQTCSIISSKSDSDGGRFFVTRIQGASGSVGVKYIAAYGIPGMPCRIVCPPTRGSTYRCTRSNAEFR